MESIKEKEKKAYDAMKEKMGYKNPMQAPRLVSVSVSTGTGSTKDKNKLKLIPERLAQITGQKVAPRKAKKSIATFKLREGDVVGYQATLRSTRMYDFLDKFLNVALPRTKDFRGVSRDAVDVMGNYTFGIKEHTIFPETSDEELKNIFGMSITIVTTAKNKEEALAFFEHLGFPFKKV
ncbi:50S ribosomal protein L5 [Patescibacteria group bacterium]